jgi:hypothetical protein
VPLAPARVLQEPCAQEQAAVGGRGCDARQATTRGSQHGDADGTRKTAAGVLRVQVPPVRGLEAPDRSPVWPHGAKTRARLKPLIVERCVGGRSQRAMEAAGEKA